MRLTADLIRDSLSYLNPLKERELDLRGHRIPNIENLGAAGPHDSIDFTDNDIQVLGNFPLSPRITTLLLARNRVSSIQPTVANSIPHLRNLVLASNNFSELAELDALGTFRSLIHLVLLDNPVTKKENYRYWVIWRCPTVRFLDYEKVKDVERKQAKELFGTAEAPSALAIKIRGTKSKGLAAPLADGPADSAKFARIKLTDGEKKRLQEMIKKASSLEEIIRLEKMINEGRLPPGFHTDPDAMEE
ncbi:related to U2 snRNP protein A` [Cephalotrichum gorgonifer]|uniref:U2 small nuclear ribonucleoprotein A' n=1 Tax=Cephalotrichum gorgonifer TaxID=2041049 RepID=A0AAE8ST91_9PEZI|nr:related to U2 snRNP protein A` [Cephalotrichum gorgonifer]